MCLDKHEYGLLHPKNVGLSSEKVHNPVIKDHIGSTVPVC